MQGIAGILGGKGGGAGAGQGCGGAAMGGTQPVRAVPAGKGPLRGGWAAGGCMGVVCVWSWFVRGAQPRRRIRPEGGGLRPGGRCGRAGLGGAGGEAAGGWVQGEAGPQGRPGRRPGRRGRPAGRGAGYAGAGRESVPCIGRQAARASKKLYTISLNCHLFLPKIKKCVKYCSQFADIMDASERDGVPKKGRSEP